MGVIVCFVKEACELMKHLNEDEMVMLSVLDRKTHIHDTSKKIKKRNDEEL